MTDSGFVSGRMAGITQEVQEVKVEHKKKRHVEVPVREIHQAKAGQKEKVDTREYVTVPFSEIPMGAICFQEIKSNTYIAYTKVNANAFPADFQVWIFR